MKHKHNNELQFFFNPHCFFSESEEHKYFVGTAKRVKFFLCLSVCLLAIVSSPIFDVSSRDVAQAVSSPASHREDLGSIPLQYSVEWP